MKINCYRYLLLCLSLLSGCIDPVNLETRSDADRLVVDGMITNEPGPYTVKLSMSAPYASYTGSWNSIVRNATVTISDNEGNRETLLEKSPGVYSTAETGLQGKIGNTYTLIVKTRQGQEYRSAPELLAPVPAIDTLYTQVRPKKILNDSGNEETIYYLDVYADALDPAIEKNYYRWQWEGIYRISTQPWDFKIKVRGEWVPAPKDCCQLCWVTEFTNSINIQDDRLINGRWLKHHLVTPIPINEKTFESKYHLEVRQLSLSEKAYDYWSALKTQTANVGNIQDPPPAVIMGNITNVTDPQDKPLGYFGASAVAKKSLFITRQELGVPVKRLVFPDDCRVQGNSSIRKPLYW